MTTGTIKTARLPLFPQLTLLFDEGRHEYRLDDGAFEWEDKTAFPSVTQFIGHYIPPFDEAGAAANAARRSGTTPDEVLKKWAASREYACDFGTRVHANQEAMLLGRTPPNRPRDERERRIMAAGWQAVSMLFAAGWRTMAAEMMVGSVRYRLAGTVDAILTRGKNEVLVADWKTNRELSASSKYGTKFLPPLDDLDDCELNKYAIQLNLYRKILLSDGYLPATANVRMCIVHLREDGPKVHEVERSRNCDALLADYLSWDWFARQPPF